MKIMNALKYICLMTQCIKHSNTVLLQKCICHKFSAFMQVYDMIVKMSEGTFCRVEVHFISAQNRDFNYSLEQALII